MSTRLTASPMKRRTNVLTTLFARMSEQHTQASKQERNTLRVCVCVCDVTHLCMSSSVPASQWMLAQTHQQPLQTCPQSSCLPQPLTGSAQGTATAEAAGAPATPRAPTSRRASRPAATARPAPQRTRTSLRASHPGTRARARWPRRDHYPRTRRGATRRRQQPRRCPRRQPRRARAAGRRRTASARGATAAAAGARSLCALRVPGRVCLPAAVRVRPIKESPTAALHKQKQAPHASQTRACEHQLSMHVQRAKAP